MPNIQMVNIMISTAVLFYLSISACSPVTAECTDGMKEIYSSLQECERVIYEEKMLSAECKPVEGVAHQK